MDFEIFQNVGLGLHYSTHSPSKTRIQIRTIQICYRVGSIVFDSRLRDHLSRVRLILNFIGLSKQISSTFSEDVSLLIYLITLHLTALSAPQTTWWMARCLINDESERQWKEAAVANIRVLTRNPPGATEENHKLHVRTIVPTRFEAGTSRTQLTVRANLLSEKMFVCYFFKTH
jgi:hypothetical protein